MSAPLWEAGKLYLPGDLVQPIQSPAPVSTAITNPSFESGTTDWTFDADAAIDATKRFSGTNSAKFTGTAGNVRVEHSKVDVAPGTSITASCMYAQGAASAGHNTGRVILRWYTSADVFISESTGNLINSSSTGWQKSTVTAAAPATAGKVAIGCLSFRDRSDASWCDLFEWNYATQTVQAGLIYQAVQADPGVSGTTEPAWPASLGLTVVDNEVTWEAVATSRVTWTASPILHSGTVEPTWPTTPGEFVSDGTISWECISRRVEDERCPNTKVVAIMAGKVYAGDGDIVRFSATSNPLDWSSADDAGFLPTGLQQANANDMAVLAPYRANLAAFNASSFQNWQVDPDPASMAILDQMDGVGSTWPKAATAVGNELFFLSALGVRTVGISAGAENLAAGDVGMPVDMLVQDAMRVTLANGDGYSARAAYYPGAGQYWLTFPNYPPAAPTISGDHANGVESVPQAATQYTTAGGVIPYGNYSISAGSLPPGRSLNAATGEITGTPTAQGAYSWTVSRTDADGTVATLADSATIGPLLAWNPADKGAEVSLSSNNRTATTTIGPGSGNQCVRSVASITSGKRYFEIVVDNKVVSASDQNGLSVGLATADASLALQVVGEDEDSWGWAAHSGKVWHWSNLSAATYGSYTTGDVLMCAVDHATQHVWFGKNGVWANSGDPAADTGFMPHPPFISLMPWGASEALFIMAEMTRRTAAPSDQLTLRSYTGQFSYAVPTGFSGWSD